MLGIPSAGEKAVEAGAAARGHRAQDRAGAPGAWAQQPGLRVSAQLLALGPGAWAAASWMRFPCQADRSEKRAMEGANFHVREALGYFLSKLQCWLSGQARHSGFPGRVVAPLTMITETPVVVLFCLGSALLKCCFSLPVTSACILFSWEASSCRRNKDSVKVFTFTANVFAPEQAHATRCPSISS